MNKLIVGRSDGSILFLDALESLSSALLLSQSTQGKRFYFIEYVELKSGKHNFGLSFDIEKKRD